MNCSLKCDRHEYTQITVFTSRSFILSVGFRFYYDREDLFTYAGDVLKWPTSLMFSHHHCHRFPCAEGFFPLILRVLILVRCRKFLCAEEQLSISLPSLRTRRCVGVRILIAATGFPDNPTCRLEALSFPGLLHAIGLFTAEELAATELVRFIAVCLDFATILFSSDCSFAILSVMQLIKLKFLAQQRELKWLMLNKQRRLFHSSRVKCPFVKNVCELVFVVNVPCLNLGVQIDSVRQPIKSNSVGS